MRKLSFALVSALVGISVALLIYPAITTPASKAQVNVNAKPAPTVTLTAGFHAYVSVNGSDSKLCTRDEPCRTFQVAVERVKTGGEVVALDSGEFGPVTIPKSVTLSAAGVHATVTQETAGADAITLKTTQSMTVIIRGLTILGVGKAGQGITLNNPHSSSESEKPFSLSALYVEDCVIAGFTVQGIVFAPGTLAQLFVKDSFIRECKYGLTIVAGMPQLQAQVSIDHTRLEHNSDAGVLTSAGFSYTTIGNSVLSGNGMAVSTGGAPSEVNVDHCLIANNSYGIFNWGTTRVANSTITNNKTGVYLAPLAPQYPNGKLLSLTTGSGVLTNTVVGNDTNGSFSGTYAAK